MNRNINYNKLKISKKMKDWCKEYETRFFGIEPMHLDDLENKKISVAEFKRSNLQWIQDHVQEQVWSMP